MPKVMSSARESSSFPISLETCNSRADIPSKKSKTAPRMMNSIACSGNPFIADTVAMQPEIRLQHVMVFGICFFIIFLT